MTNDETTVVRGSYSANVGAIFRWATSIVDECEKKVPDGDLIIDKAYMILGELGRSSLTELSTEGPSSSSSSRKKKGRKRLDGHPRKKGRSPLTPEVMAEMFEGVVGDVVGLEEKKKSRLSRETDEIDVEERPTPSSAPAAGPKSEDGQTTKKRSYTFQKKRWRCGICGELELTTPEATQHSKQAHDHHLEMLGPSAMYPGHQQDQEGPA